MPPKIRELEARLRDAGFVRQASKGSHRKWTHPAGRFVVISGGAGDDAKKYQDRSRRPSSQSRATPGPDDYQIVLQWSDDDHCYLVTLPAWQNARTHGATPEAAVRSARQVLRLLLDSARRHGEPIPPPERRYSGNLRLRLPVSLHGRLVREAEREGVSLNQWIVSRLAG